MVFWFHPTAKGEVMAFKYWDSYIANVESPDVVDRHTSDEHVLHLPNSVFIQQDPIFLDRSFSDVYDVGGNPEPIRM